MVTVVGNVDYNTSSNPGRDCFHFPSLSYLGKGKIHLFSLQFWVNSCENWSLQAWYVNQCRKKEISEFKFVKLHLKIDLVSYPARGEG